MIDFAGMLAAGRMSRSLIVVSVFSVLFAVIGLRGVLVALSGGEAQASVALGQPEQLPDRADIHDRNGELLATSVTVYSLYADPRAIWDADDVASELVGLFPELDRDTITRRLSDRERAFVWIKRGLTPRQREAVFGLGVEGLGFQLERQRAYPRGVQAGHVLGHTDIDGRGQMGIELALQDRLEADDKPVRLTLEAGVQFALEAELEEAAQTFAISGGAGLVVHAPTGEIRALASWPKFDPNRPRQAQETARLNRVSGAVYELGSIFKPLAIAAALDSDTLLPDDVLDVRTELVIDGYRITDTHDAGARMDVARILAESSNIGTVRIAQRLGGDVMVAGFDRLGLLGKPTLELPGRAAPILPDRWTDLSYATTSYGHGIAVSPLAFARGFAALANGGLVPELTLLADRPPVEDRALTRFVTADTANIVVDMLRQAVADGTGRRADVAGYRVAGKTGTAEKPIAGGYAEDRNVNSFAALFPSDRPEYVLLIVLDDPRLGDAPGGTAALNAAPVAGRVIERIAPFLGIDPKFDNLTRVEDASSQGSVP